MSGVKTGIHNAARPRWAGTRLSCTGQSRKMGLWVTQVKFRALTLSAFPPLLPSCWG